MSIKLLPLFGIAIYIIAIGTLNGPKGGWNFMDRTVRHITKQTEERNNGSGYLVFSVAESKQMIQNNDKLKLLHVNKKETGGTPLVQSSV